jgi:ornithine cyclodeaminase/alanine dehydrogenase-like protein (mu-crystallin family)
MFKDDNSLIGDDLLKPFKHLKERSSSFDCNVGTSSVLSVKQADVVVFIEVPLDDDPVYLEAVLLKRPIYLVLLESDAILPRNWDKKNHSKFKKVFTDEEEEEVLKGWGL